MHLFDDIYVLVCVVVGCVARDVSIVLSDKVYIRDLLAQSTDKSRISEGCITIYTWSDAPYKQAFR